MSSPSTPAVHRAPVLMLAGLVVAVFAVTLPGDFVWDDEFLISTNARLRGEGAWQRALTDDFWNTTLPTDAWRVYWRPVVKLSHVALVSLGGASWPFHLLNLLLHLGCVLLAYRWLVARLAEVVGSPEQAVRPALLGAALFAVHPSRYGVVGWISCSTDLFMALFALAALWAFERRRYVAGAALIALAMASKESVLVLPLAFALDGLLLKRLDVRALAALAAGLAAPLIIRRILGLSSPPLAPLPFDETLVRALTATGLYHARTVWPFPATLEPYLPAATGGLARYGVIFGALGLASAASWLAVTVAALKRPALRPWLADAAWWAVLLLPFLQLVPLTANTFVSDRFLYLPLLGACALAARAVARIGGRAVPGAMLAAVGASAVVTSLALPSFDSAVELFGREYRLHRDRPLAAMGYAGELARKGAFADARVVLLRLLKQRDDLQARSWALAQYANVTTQLSRGGDPRVLSGLRRFYEGLSSGQPVALELGDERYELPDDVAAFSRLAKRGAFDDLALFHTMVLLEQGDFDAAAKAGRELLAKPTERRRVLAARTLAAQRDFASATEVLRRATGRDGQALALAVNEASRLPAEPVGRCGAEQACDEPERALRRAWVGAWHALGIRRREDEALDALGEDAAAPSLRLRALVARGQREEAEALLASGKIGEPLRSEAAALLEEQRDAEAARAESLGD